MRISDWSSDVCSSDLIKAHRLTLIFCNTRGLAELIFQDLWKINEDDLPIGVHHGSLSVEVRRRMEAAMGEGRIRALVATASLDLGVDRGDVDLVKIGRAACRDRVCQYWWILEVAATLNKKTNQTHY